LSGDATAAQYQAALQSVTWNVNGLISLGTWTFEFRTKDQQNVQSAASTMSITLVSIL
jgi:hypothetical protein